MLCSQILNLQMVRKVFLATPNDTLAKYHSLNSSTRKSLCSFARCCGQLQMTSWQNALLSNRRHAHVQQVVYWDFGADEFEKGEVGGRSITKKREALHLFSIIFNAAFPFGPSPRFVFLVVCYLQLAHAYEVSQGVLGYSK